MEQIVSPQHRAGLCAALADDDPTARLWEMVHDGRMAEAVPEVLDLDMAQERLPRHKDILAHTLTVVGQAPDDLTVRLAALFHDIGKPATRRYENGEVTFRNHEAVGARMARECLVRLGFDERTVEDVSELVRLSGRFKGYEAGWSDSAVRRYARDAGHLLPALNGLVRADCTSKHRYKRDRLQHSVDDLERRVGEIDRADRRAAERPQIDGNAVMERYGVKPGPEVGRALKWLLEIRRAEGDLPDDTLLERLDRWWDANCG